MKIVKQWDKTFKAKIVEEYKNRPRGMTGEAFCEEKGIPLNRLRDWNFRVNKERECNSHSKSLSFKKSLQLGIGPAFTTTGLTVIGSSFNADISRAVLQAAVLFTHSVTTALLNALSDGSSTSKR